QDRGARPRDTSRLSGGRRAGRGSGADRAARASVHAARAGGTRGHDRRGVRAGDPHIDGRRRIVTRGAAREARPGAAPRVRDADAARAARTEGLLASLAASLGLSIDSIRVHVDEEAAARTRPRGARGLMHGGVVWLDPHRYDPQTADGRALLAHEAAHLAQREELRLPPDRDAPSLHAAEAEAATFADAA